MLLAFLTVTDSAGTTLVHPGQRRISRIIRRPQKTVLKAVARLKVSGWMRQSSRTDIPTAGVVTAATYRLLLPSDDRLRPLASGEHEPSQEVSALFLPTGEGEADTSCVESLGLAGDDATLRGAGTPTQGRLLELLLAAGEATKIEPRERSGYSSSTVSRALTALQKSGQVVADGNTRNRVFRPSPHWLATREVHAAFSYTMSRRLDLRKLHDAQREQFLKRQVERSRSGKHRHGATSAGGSGPRASTRTSTSSRPAT